jgi:hypothetical protein
MADPPRCRPSCPTIAVRRTASRSLSSGRPLRAGPVASPMVPSAHALVVAQDVDGTRPAMTTSTALAPCYLRAMDR